MSKSTVLFAPVKNDDPIPAIAERLSALWDRCQWDGLITPKDYVAVKLHFGEKGNRNHLDPQLVRRVVEKCKPGLPFVTDTNTLYVSARSNAVVHLKTAAAHGYTLEAVGAPVLIADGLASRNFLKVEINQKHFKSVHIAADIAHADALIALTHVTGHIGVGYGGALKNIGMGCASRSGKQQQHTDTLPKVSAAKCTACGRCTKFCPENAIRVADKTAVVDQRACSGCGECTVVCRYGAIAISWGAATHTLQERIVEYTLGALAGKKGKCAFLNFVLGVTKNCDCMAQAEPSVCDDLGILASTDPVAVEQATLDLIKRHHKKDIFRVLYPDIDHTHQLLYAASLGLGSREYELQEI